MATVIRPPEDNDVAEFTIDEWTFPTFNVETFGCGEADEADQQGIQPLVTDT